MKKFLVVLLLVIATVFTVAGCSLIPGSTETEKYTVTFDTDGGSAVESQTVESGKTATAPTAPTKTGYTFAGWFVGETAYDFATPVTANVTVKAAWTVNNYTVTFDTNGGSNVAAQTVAYGTTATAPVAPTKTGYTFAGWFVGETAYDFATLVTADVTVKAAWTANNYEVSFDTDGADAIASVTVTYGETAAKPADPAKTGYTFAGWFVGETEYDFATPVTGNITIKAAWTINSYTVTFDTTGGSDVAAQTVTYGATATAPTAPTKTGYTFAGWFVGETEYDFATPVVADVTVVAAWTANGYEVTFATDGGTTIDPVVVTYGETVAKPADPTKTGYTFAGWFVGGNAYDFATPITDNITIKAAWNINSYIVAFDANGGSGDDKQSIAYGSTAKIPAVPTKPGFAFDGWYLDGAKYDFATPVTTDITLVAKWTLDLPDLSAIAGTYTGKEDVGYNAVNAYTFVINADGTIVASYENSYTAVDLTVNYVLFENNVLTINYTASSTTANLVFKYADSKLVTDSAVAGMPLTIAKTYTVAFDSNGANKDKEFIVEHGATLDEYKPTRTGYDLEGWYCNGVKFDFTTPITADMTLVANWEVKMITLTFYAQDYTTVQETIKVAYNTVFGDVETPATVTTADGYKFNGKWYGSATATSPVSATSKLTSDKSYYPGFIAPMDGIAGTWSGADKNGVEYSLVIDAATQSVTATIVKDGVTDELDITVIYFKDFNGTVKLVIRYIADGATSETTLTLTYAPDGTFTGSNSLVIAKEGAKSYTVTFNTDGGNAIDGQSVQEGNTVVKPADPTKEGFEFAGWFIGDIEYDFTTPVTSDVTITAKWAEKTVEYTVTFNSNGGSAVTAQTIGNGGVATMPTDPTLRNYTFDGWYLGETEYDFSTPVTADITLVAKWKGVEKALKIYKQDGTLYAEVGAEYGKTYAQVLSKYLTGTESDTVSDEALAQLSANLITVEGSYFTGAWFTSANGSTAFDPNATVTAAKNMHASFIAPVIKELEGTWTCTYSNKVYEFTIIIETDGAGNIVNVSAKTVKAGAEAEATIVRTYIKDGQLPQIIIKSDSTYTIKQVLNSETGEYIWQYSNQTLTEVV